MTDKPTPEQIQRACDLVNSESRAAGDGSIWNPLDFDVFPSLKVLADTIAKLDAMQADRDKARAECAAANVRASELSRGFDKAAADLAKISRLLDQPTVNPARAIAAPCRVETDPLVAAISAAIGEYIMPGAPWDKLRAELAKRGLEIGRAA